MFKRGDLVTSKDTSNMIYYVQDSYESIGGQEFDLPFVTCIGQKLKIVVINGNRYSEDNIKLISSIFREENE